MSEYIQVLDYPNLSEEHLEILPNLNVKLQYQDVPTVAPILSYEEKSRKARIQTTQPQPYFHQHHWCRGII